MEESPELLRWYREWIKDIPDELTTVVAHRKARAVAPWPEQWHGKHVVMVLCCYAGGIEEGQRVIRPLREWGEPILDGCMPKPFLAH